MLMFGTYWDHIWPCFTSRAARALKCSSPSRHCLRHMSMKLFFYGIMSVQCLNKTGTIVCLTILSNKIMLLKFSRQCQDGYGVSIFWIMPRKCLDQVGTKFGLVFLIAWFLHYFSVCCVLHPFTRVLFIALSQSVLFFHPFTQVLQWRSCRPLVLFSF